MPGTGPRRRDGHARRPCFPEAALCALLFLAALLAGGAAARAADPIGLPSGQVGLAEHAFHRALDLNTRGLPREAIGLLRFAVEARPHVALYHEALADTYLALGNADAAVLAMDQYKRALELEPGRARAHEGLVQAAFIAGRLGDALDSLETLTFRGGAVRPQYLTDLVALYVLADQPARGIAALGRSRPPPQARAIVLLGLATLHRYEDRFDTAIALAGQAEADAAAPADVRGLAGELAAKWTAEREEAP